MSIFSFIKDVGEKLFGASEAKAATADELRKELEKHNLSAEGLDITVDNDKVTVTGQARSTEEAEKISLALGNTGAWRPSTTSCRSKRRLRKPPCTPSSRATRFGRLRKPITAK